MPKSLENCTLYLAEKMGTSRNTKRTSTTDLFATQNKHFKYAYESSESPGKLTPNNDMSNNSDTKEHPDTNKSTPNNGQKIDPTSPPNVKSSFEPGLLKAELEDDDDDSWGIKTSDQGRSIYNSSSQYKLPECSSKQFPSTSEISDRLTMTFFSEVEKINDDKRTPNDCSTITSNIHAASYNQFIFNRLLRIPDLTKEDIHHHFLRLAHPIPDGKTAENCFADMILRMFTKGNVDLDLGAEAAASYNEYIFHCTSRLDPPLEIKSIDDSFLRPVQPHQAELYNQFIFNRLSCIPNITKKAIRHHFFCLAHPLPNGKTADECFSLMVLRRMFTKGNIKLGTEAASYNEYIFHRLLSLDPLFRNKSIYDHFVHFAYKPPYESVDDCFSRLVKLNNFLQFAHPLLDESLHHFFSRLAHPLPADDVGDDLAAEMGVINERNKLCGIFL